jgi:hypothetical protein
LIAFDLDLDGKPYSKNKKPKYPKGSTYDKNTEYATGESGFTSII